MPKQANYKLKHRSVAIRVIAAMIIFALIALVQFVGQARGVQVQDLVRVKGAEANKLVGMGIVVGLNGTGDGGKFQPAMRSLASVVQRLTDPATVSSELKDAKNVALVTLTANLPRGGVREGDKVNVHVAALAASSLKGGRLFLIPMKGPLKDSPVFAFAEGPITIEDDATPTIGVVRKGAQLTKDLYAEYMDDAGRVTLVLNQSIATLPMANNLATLINGYLSPDGPDIARALDQKNVVVDVPKSEQRNPVSFISSVLQTFVEAQMINTGARVLINERTGTIVFSHDVQISPVGVTHKGMTINMITPAPVPSVERPISERKLVLGIDPEKRGGAKLADLITAFNQMKVDADDRISIIKEIHRSGKLHAQLIIEE